MPENTLFDHLAAAFGGGPDREEAYGEGRLKRARTDDALARARVNRDKAIARSRVGGAESLQDVDLTDVLMGELGSDFSGVQQGRLRDQEHGFREQIADPETAMPERQYAAQAVAGRPFNFLDSMGQGEYADIRDPDAGVQQTDLGVQVEDAYRALAEQRRQPGSTSEPLVRAVDPETGQEVYVPRGQGAGMRPAPRGQSPQDAAMNALAREVGSSAYYQNWESLPDEERAQAAIEIVNQLFGQQQGQPEPPPAPGGDGEPDEGGFVPQKVYVDANGNRARYLGNGQWEEIAPQG